jgi:potassium-transporting ATPase KdpC subunit
MHSNLLTSVRVLAVLTLLTGVVYPVAITLVAQVLLPHQASGSLVTKNGQVIGSRLLAQKVTDPKYFWYRPSASDYGTFPSGASNLSPASQNFVKAVQERQAVLGQTAPADLLTSSGSGLDPDISPEGATFQLTRIAKARALDEASTIRLQSLVESAVAKAKGGWGRPSMNVMDLNRMLDEFAGSQ